MLDILDGVCCCWCCSGCCWKIHFLHALCRKAPLAVKSCKQLILQAENHTYALTYAHTHTRKYARTHTQSVSLSLTHTHSLSLSHTHTRTHACTHTHTRTHACTHTHTHSLSLSHTHMPSHPPTHLPTHIFTHIFPLISPDNLTVKTESVCHHKQQQWKQKAGLVLYKLNLFISTRTQRSLAISHAECVECCNEDTLSMYHHVCGWALMTIVLTPWWSARCEETVSVHYRMMLNRLARQKKLNNSALKILLVPALEHLNLEDVFLTQNTLRIVYTQCPQLKSISLRNCGYIMTDSVLNQLTKVSQNLCSLSYWKNLCSPFIFNKINTFVPFKYLLIILGQLITKSWSLEFWFNKVHTPWNLFQARQPFKTVNASASRK